MTTRSFKYRFVRADGIEGFMAQQRPSTDALNALEQWRTLGAGRRYTVIEDDDAFVVVGLSIEDTDTVAGDDLASCARARGVVGSLA